MDNRQVYTKTDLGRSEIDTRAMKLSPSLRSILLVVDGQRNDAQLRALGGRLHAPADAIDQLLRIGLIGSVTAGVGPDAPVAEVSDIGTRYRTLSGLMSEAVREHLGLRGYFMQLKIERCADAAELAALLPDLRGAVAKAKGVPYASQWEQGVREAAVA